MKKKYYSPEFEITKFTMESIMMEIQPSETEWIPDESGDLD